MVRICYVRRLRLFGIRNNRSGSNRGPRHSSPPTATTFKVITAREQIIETQFERVRLERQIRRLQISAFLHAFGAVSYLSLVLIFAVSLNNDEPNYTVAGLLLVYYFVMVVRARYKKKGSIGFQINTRKRSIFGIHFFYYDAWPTQKKRDKFLVSRN